MTVGAASSAGIHALTQSQVIQVHAFLLVHGQQLVLIDMLCSANAAVILRGIADLGRSVQDLKHIVLTHAHRAAQGGPAKLKELSGASVYCHAWEADIVTGDRPIQQVSLVPRRPFRIWLSEVTAPFSA